jgi:hypothetical protein
MKGIWKVTTAPTGRGGSETSVLRKCWKKRTDEWKCWKKRTVG